MRFLHTADWHLGRIFYGVHLTEDQAHLLDQVVALAREAEVDAVLVAGDVYDRAVPPPDAVALLGEVLDRLVGGAGIPTCIVAGNHDSPQRLHFCSGILARSELNICGLLSPEPFTVRLEDRHGAVRIALLPYAEPSFARDQLGVDDLDTHGDVVRRSVERVRDSARPGERTVVLNHSFVAGGQTSDSERPLTVGGAGQVHTDAFAGVDLVALGHLHRPQTLDDGRITYAGSLMTYSFEESSGVRSVSLIDLDGNGTVRIERIPLTPHRDVRCLEGTLQQVLAAAEHDAAPHDYLQVTLTDPGLVHDPMGRLREVYPNVLHVVRPALGATSAAQLESGPEGRRATTLELFAQLYRERRGCDLDPDRQRILRELVDRLRSEDREASA